MASALSSSGRYVILIRHASRSYDSAAAESEQSMVAWQDQLARIQPDFTTKGLPRTLALAHRLADELGDAQVRRIIHSPHLVAEQTAKAVRFVMGERGTGLGPSSARPELDPDHFRARCAAEMVRRIVSSGDAGAGSVTVVVGHQPMLTQLANELTWEKLQAGTLPLDGSEIACIEVTAGSDPMLLWLLTEKSSELMADLKAKIESKYDVAKFFLGAFVVNSGFIVSSEIWKVSSPFSTALVYAGFLLMLAALALTAGTLFAYDALMMPPAFWDQPQERQRAAGSSPRPRKWSILRPPSQAHVVLFYEMVHVWMSLFLPAIACTFGAVTLFVMALAHERLGQEEWALGVPPAALVSVVTLGAALAIGGATIYARRMLPELGVED